MKSMLAEAILADLSWENGNHIGRTGMSVQAHGLHH